MNSIFTLFLLRKIGFWYLAKTNFDLKSEKNIIKLRKNYLNQESSLEKVFKSCYLGEFRRVKIPSIKISLRSN